MNTVVDNIAETIAPVRAEFLARLLDRVEGMSDSGFDFEQEVVRREADGSIMRNDVLNLPSRADIRIAEGGHGLDIDLAPEVAECIEDRVIFLTEDVSLIMRPFAWNALVIGVDMAGNIRQFQRLRNWYLEWFQARLLYQSPGLFGCVHRLQGPERRNGQWELTVDLGTAGAEAMLDLLEALISCGVTKIELGASRVPSHAPS